jgi:hypothetical protein
MDLDTWLRGRIGVSVPVYPVLLFPSGITTTTVVNSYIELGILALTLLLVGLPLRVFLFTPDQSSLVTFVDPGFWIAVGAGVLSILFGFWPGTRSAYT